MGILEKLGLAQKKKEGAPMIGENKKKEQEAAADYKRKYIRWSIFVGFLAILLYALPQTSFRQVASYTVGEPWRADDLTAPFTFALQKSEAELEEERQQIQRNTSPIFHINHNARITIQSRLDSIFRNVQPVLDAHLQWQRARQAPDLSASTDSIRFVDERSNSGIELSESSWNTLLEDYTAAHLESDTYQGYIGTDLRTRITNLTRELLNEGVLNISKSELDNNEITLRDLRERTERNVSLANVRDMNEAREYASYTFSNIYSASEYSDLALELFTRILVPNWIFSTSDTQSRLDEAMEEISTTKGAVAQGQVIIRNGDIVTQEKANMLRSLADARAETASEIERWLRFGGEVIVITIVSLFFLFYLYLYRRSIYEDNAMFLLVFLVMGILCLASGIIHSFDNLSPYLIPVAIAPLILTIIFDSRVGLMATITLAVITAIFHDNNFDYLIATVMACGFGVFSVRDINKRTQFFVTTPVVVIIGYVLVLAGFALTRFGGWDTLLDQLFFVLVNAVFILFTYPLILFFEKSFNVTTDFTLLELNDTNLPLLKDLMNQAPGTFHHSLQVANLAESAASSIGANALKCRVGALYHDIGKMKKPAYFIENQSGQNEHNKLKPRMSALVIKAHVSDGVTMAREHDLPDTIIDFIKTHHGKSLIKYFYEKALKNAENESEIQEEDFRHDGPIPFTKETGILLLADSVEAASRAMKDPTYSKLENLITRLVDDYVHEGQLKHCPLTFHQLDIIKKTFLNILVGVYHSRVEYPEDEKAGKDKIQQKTLSSESSSEAAPDTESEDKNEGEQNPDQPAE
ncbi:MAG: HDIG domain-containing metalloprotein [Balneolaceae bacterium]